MDWESKMAAMAYQSFELTRILVKKMSRWWPWQSFWILHLNDFHYLLSTSCPDSSYHLLSQLAFGFRRSSSK